MVKMMATEMEIIYEGTDCYVMKKQTCWSVTGSVLLPVWALGFYAQDLTIKAIYFRPFITTMDPY